MEFCTMKCIKTKQSDNSWKFSKVSDTVAFSMQKSGKIILDRDDLTKVPVGSSVFISKSEYKRNEL